MWRQVRILKENNAVRPTVLLIASKFDYSTDHISFQLEDMGVNYLRLNTDQLSEYRLCLDPINARLSGHDESELEFEIDESSLRAIYFRAPTFLRDNYQPDLDLHDQLKRTQWAAFVRALSVFDGVKWVNHPQATYQAEIKPYQLRVAERVGFRVPETRVTNSATHVDFGSSVIMKALDTVLLKSKGRESFVYTHLLHSDELREGDLSIAPVILQTPLVPKTDIRVTVIGSEVFATSIKIGGKGTDTDWRIHKHSVSYEAIVLPPSIEKKCIELVSSLGLSFGAIDLIDHDNEYHFVEINPTGEWAWLMEPTGMAIDKALAEFLVRDERRSQL